MNNPRLWLGLTILLAGVVLAVTLQRSSKPVHAVGRVVPELIDSEVVRLAIERAGQPAVVLARKAPAGALLLAAPGAATNRAAVNALIRHLIELKMDGRAGTGGVESPPLSVALTFRDGTRVTLAFAAAGAGRTRVYRADLSKAYWVESGRVQALADAVSSLRRRHLFATPVSAVSGLELSAGKVSLLLSGKPLQLHREAGGTAPVQLGVLMPAVNAVVTAEMVRFVDGSTDPPKADAFTLVVRGAEGKERLQHLGDCPGAPKLWLVTSPAGRGCVDPGPFEALAKLARQPDKLIAPSQ